MDMTTPRSYEKSHFLVYSNLSEPFSTNAENYCQSALNVGFDTATHFTEPMLRETPFWAENAEILEQPRGAGYWLWKPYIILQKLRSVGPNDIVIYNDAGRYASESFAPFPCFPHAAAELTARSPNRFIHGFVNDWLVQGDYTKRDCFVSMDADNIIMHLASLISASPLLYMPSPQSFDFLERWIAFARDPRILTDQPNELGENLDRFNEHRHDQSISSILAHQSGAHYFDLSKRGGYQFAEEVRRRNRHVPRCQTHIGYLSLMVARALPDDFFVRGDFALSDAKDIARNLLPEEPIPQHPDSVSATSLRSQAVAQVNAGIFSLSRDQVRAVLTNNQVTSGKIHQLSKHEKNEAFWDMVKAEAQKRAQGKKQGISEEEFAVLCMEAFFSAEKADPKLRVEMLAGYVWGCLNEDMRALFKTVYRSAKSTRGQSALLEFVAFVGPDAVVPTELEAKQEHKTVKKLINENMCHWLTIPRENQ